MPENSSDWIRGEVQLPNWTYDPFSHLSKDEKRRIRYIERDADEKMKQIHPNGGFMLKVPKKLPGRFTEPESMTIRRKGRVYMEPHPVKMKEPKIWRGRGRTWRERERVEREREE